MIARLIPSRMSFALAFVPLASPCIAQSVRVAQLSPGDVSDILSPWTATSAWSTTQTSPVSARQGPDGMLYVTERGTLNTVRRYFPNGTLDTSFTLPPATPPLTLPVDVAFDAKKNWLYVSDQGGQVARFWLSNAAGVIQALAPLTTSLIQPTGLLTGTDGSLFVADAGATTNCVFRFLPNATTPNVFIASGAGGLNGPTQMVRTKLRFYVVSALGNQLISYNVAGGGAVVEAPTSGGGDALSFPIGVAVNADGDIFVSSFSSNQVLRYDFDGAGYLGAVAATDPMFLSWVDEIRAPFPLKRGDVVTTWCVDDYAAITLGPQPKPCVSVVATRFGGPTGENWPAPQFWNKSGGFDAWTLPNLGPVFGLTLDAAEAPSIYVCATTTYSALIPMGPAGGGGVYKLDGCDGHISKWMVTGSGAIGTNTLPNTGCGLGNICYDWRHRQFFVTNFEDGKIYRVKSNGKQGIVQQVFDPFAADDGAGGPAPLGERVWAVCVPTPSPVAGGTDRLYFSAWLCDSGRAAPATWPASWPGASLVVNNAIFEVALNPNTGAIVGTASLWKVMPLLAAGTNSNPVSDLSHRNGILYMAERTMNADTGDHTFVLGAPDNAFAARVLMRIDTPLAAFDFRYRVGDFGTPNGWNASGGVALGPIRDLWATGDALHFGVNDRLQGLQHFRWQGNATASPLSAPTKLIDMDGGFGPYHFEQPGDVECVPYDAVTTNCLPPGGG